MGELPDVDMATDLASFRAANPVLTASGCAAAGRELHQFFDVAELGGVVTKSVMMRPRAGRPTPRMAETPAGMLNSIGLQGPGIDAFCDHDLPWLADRGAKAVVSIAGGHVEDYRMLAHRLRDEPGVAMVEVNISCPNVEDRGQVFACDPWEASRVIRAVRGELTGKVPLFAKLSPDVTDIVEIAKACVDAGADGLSMINTLLGMVIDTETMRPQLGGGTGGLSGPAIRPIAVRCVWQVHQAMPYIPILGMGGIMTGEDALEFILAGASAVSVGTAVFHDPSAPIRVLYELREALARRGFRRLSDAIGYAHRPARPSVTAVPEVGPAEEMATPEEVAAVDRADSADSAEVAQPLGASGEQAADAEALGEPAVRVKSTPRAEAAGEPVVRVTTTARVESNGRADSDGRTGSDDRAGSDSRARSGGRAGSGGRPGSVGRAEAAREQTEASAAPVRADAKRIPTTGLQVAAGPHPDAVAEAGELADEMAESEAMADAGLDDDLDSETDGDTGGDTAGDTAGDTGRDTSRDTAGNTDAADAARASRSTGRG
jgi:dihydroorotate dehydrogenase (NAD+) catalytic subunit